MKSTAVLATFLFALAVDGHLLRSRSRAKQEPDTSCGKGFDALVQGSKDYFETAMKELFIHPAHKSDAGTFAPELKCWFANMNTVNCGDLPSQAEARKADLTAKCQDPTVDWLEINKLMNKDEFKWFKQNYPAKPEDEEDPEGFYYKQAMQTVKTIDKKEILCLTLFTIDDGCVKFKYIKLAK